MKVVDARRVAQGAVKAALAAPVGTERAPRTVGPFAVLVHVMPHAIEAGMLPPDADVRAHPHIGLAAVSYLLDGHVTHRDSLGSRREIGPGELGVTIAGRGVVHSERFDRQRTLGGSMEMLQILIALPDGSEDLEPSFAHVAAAELPEVAEAGAIVRALAPSVTFPAPLLLDDVRLDRGARYGLPAGFAERAVYVISGELEVDGTRVGAQQTALIGPGASVAVATAAAHVIAFGGEPVGPRYMWWNYIHSSLEKIEEAKAEWRAGRVTRPPGDTESFTPAPPDDGRPLHRLNAAAAT